MKHIALFLLDGRLRHGVMCMCMNGKACCDIQVVSFLWARLEKGPRTAYGQDWGEGTAHNDAEGKDPALVSAGEPKRGRGWPTAPPRRREPELLRRRRMGGEVYRHWGGGERRGWGGDSRAWLTALV